MEYNLRIKNGYTECCGEELGVNELNFKFNSLDELFNFIVITEKNRMEEEMIFEMQGCD